MEVLTSLQEAIAAAAERVGPSVVGLGRGWGLGSGVVIGAGQVLTNAHNVRREQVTVAFADGRRETGEWTRRRRGPRPRRRRRSTPATRRRSPGSPATRPASARRWSRSPTRAGGACGPRSASSPSEGRSFRGPRGRRIAGAIEHIGAAAARLVRRPARGRRRPAARAERAAPRGRADPGGAGDRAGQGARPAAQPRRGAGGAAARRGDRARRARRAGCAARSACPSGRACWCAAVEDGSPAAARGHRARATCWRPPTASSSTASTPSTRLLDAVAGGGSLDLTVVRGTEERTVTAELRGDRSRGVSAVAEAPPPVDPTEAEALDAYSNAVIAVAERGRPVGGEPARDAPRARRPGARRGPAARSRSRPTATCSPTPTWSAAG